MLFLKKYSMETNAEWASTGELTKDNNRQDISEKKEIPDSEIYKVKDGDVKFNNRIIRIEEGSAAAKAGLKSGESIISIDGCEITPNKHIGETVQTKPGETKKIRVLGVDGREREVEIRPNWDEETRMWLLGLVYNFEPLDLADNLAHKSVNLPLEYKNAENEIFFHGYVILGPEEQYQDSEDDTGKDRTRKQREIKKYVLQYGHNSEYDIIAMFNSQRAKLYWRPELKNVGVCFQAEKIVAIKDIFSSLCPHTLLHEFRHSYQYAQGMFKNLRFHYRSTGKEDYHNVESYTERIRQPLGQEEATEILRLILGDEQAKQIIKPFIEKLHGLDEAEKRMQKLKLLSGLSKLDVSVFSDEEFRWEFRKLKEPIYKKYLRPLTGAILDNFRSVFFSKGYSMTPQKAEVFYKRRKIDENTDRYLREEACQYIENCLKGDDGEQIVSFDWSDTRIDEDGNVTIRGSGAGDKAELKFSIGAEKVTAFNEAKQKAFNELKSERLKLEEKYRKKLQTRKQESEREMEQTLQLIEKLKKSIPDATSTVMEGVRVIDIFRFPTLIIERDAERAALVGLRTIKRETGIDLLKRENVSKVPEDRSIINERLGIRELKESIASLRSIEAYMNLIGVPNGCLRELKKFARKEREEVLKTE